nr:hypothetical protein [Tanacetum cinerariifolium]
MEVPSVDIRTGRQNLLPGGNHVELPAGRQSFLPGGRDLVAQCDLLFSSSLVFRLTLSPLVQSIPHAKKLSTFAFPFLRLEGPDSCDGEFNEDYDTSYCCLMVIMVLVNTKLVRFPAKKERHRQSYRGGKVSRLDSVTGGRLSWNGTQLCMGGIPYGIAAVCHRMRTMFLAELRGCGACASGEAAVNCMVRARARIVRNLYLFLSQPFDERFGHDPLPSDHRVNVELLGLLDHHSTIIRRYPETLLCLIGLSHSFDDVHVRPTLLKDDDSDMVLLDFVKSGNPFKIVEHTIIDELKEHAGKKKKRVVFEDLPVKRLRADAVVPTTGGKSPATLKRLESQSGPQGVKSSFVLPPAEEFVSSFVTPTPEPDVPEDSGSTQDGGVGTHHASMGIVVSSSSEPENECNAKIAALKARLEEVEREAAEVVALHNRVSKLEARVIVKSQEVDTLNTSLSWGDFEHLRMEAVGEAKLREEFKSFQDFEARRFEQKSAELDAYIADVKHDMDNDLYPHMFTTIARQRWILSYGVRLSMMKCAYSAECRSALGKVISLATNKGIQEGLEAGIKHGKFDELESLKDSPLASIIGKMLLSEVVPTARAAAERRGLYPPPLGSAPQLPVVKAHVNLFDTHILDGASGT